MRIHAIKTGEVAIKSRQREGVGKGALRQINTLLDDEWSDWLPIFCWVIEHPEGLIVVDTGETSKTSSPSYFPRWHPYFRFGVRMRVEPEQEAGPQIQKLGLSLNDVRWVVMTHLHTDHAGGVSHFSKAEFLVSRTEYKSSVGWMGKMRGYLPDAIPAWFAPRIVDYAIGEYSSFSTGYTLTEAGDVFVVPTPGHTPGHQSVILRDQDATYLFAGDSSYTEGHMVGGVVDGVSPNAGLARDTLFRIQRFLRAEPAVYLPSHDPMSEERMVRKVHTIL